MYYIGRSDDPERRLYEHNESHHLTYTCKNLPWKLKARIAISEHRGEAMKLEKYIKNKKRRSFIESIIQNQNDEIFIQELILLSSAG